MLFVNLYPLSWSSSTHQNVFSGLVDTLVVPCNQVTVAAWPHPSPFYERCYYGHILLLFYVWCSVRGFMHYLQYTMKDGMEDVRFLHLRGIPLAHYSSFILPSVNSLLSQREAYNYWVTSAQHLWHEQEVRQVIVHCGVRILVLSVMLRNVIYSGVGDTNSTPSHLWHFACKRGDSVAALNVCELGSSILYKWTGQEWIKGHLTKP